MSQCLPCEQGKFSSSPGATECDPCAGGTTSSAGSTSCDEGCPAGTIAVSTSCVDCPEGKTSASGDEDCTDCNPGSYASAPGSSSCSLCQAGKSAPLSTSTNCTICPSGTYSSLGASSCTDCLPGYFSSEGAASCSDACPPGSYTEDAGSSECTLCPAGYYQDTEGSSSCIICPVQTYCPEPGGCASCLLCVDGTYAWSAGWSECIDCLAGRVGRGDGSGCTSCNTGTYAPTAGIPSTVGCSICEAGRYSGGNGRQESCTQCPAGFYSGEQASECTYCEAGRFSGTEAASCTACPGGRYSFSGVSSCTACPLGTFSPPASAACEHCNNGTFGARTAAANCTACVPGRFTLEEGAFTSCAACAKGKEAPSTSSTSCTPCNAGSFSAEVGTATCGDCSAGYWCGAGSTSATQHECANATEAGGVNPERFYCPAGTGSRATRGVVTSNDNEYTVPEGEAFRFTREATERCPRTSNCENGLRYDAFLWISGSCADASNADDDSSSSSSAVAVDVDEASAGVKVGDVQRVLSPYAVAFSLDPALDFNASGGVGPFTLNATDTAVQVLVAEGYNGGGGLDFETTSHYDLRLFAHSNETTLNCSFSVEVTDVNEPPTLLVGPLRNVSEAAGVNDYVEGPPVKADDEDSGDEHIFSILKIDGQDYDESADPMFGIGGCSGRVYVKSEGLDALTKPEWSLLVRVMDDAGDDPLYDTGLLNVTVLNANEAPSFTVEGQSATNPTDPGDVLCGVDEGSPANASVTGLNCNPIPWTDPDLPFGDYVTWSISRADSEGSFQIDPISGNLSVARVNAEGSAVVLDYEDNKRFSIEVTITDSGGLSASLDILVVLRNVNEPPTTTFPGVILVPEQTATGTEVCAAALVTTEDPDSDTFTYRLEEYGALCSSCVYVDAATGDDDANDGSESAPFATVAGAQSNAPTGADGCVLSAGTYVVSSDFTFKTGWSYTGQGLATVIQGGSAAYATSVTFVRLVYDCNFVATTRIFYGKSLTFLNVALVNDRSNEAVRELLWYSEEEGDTNLVLENCLLFDSVLTQWTFPQTVSTFTVSGTVSANCSGFGLENQGAPAVDVDWRTYEIISTPGGDDDDELDLAASGVYAGQWGWSFATSAYERFAIDNNTGAISVAEGSALDYEERSEYRLTVVTTDDGVPPASSATTVSITLLDVVS